MQTSRRTFTTALAALASGGALAACGRGAGAGKRIRLGFVPSWSDGLSMTHLLKTQLEKAGYQIKLTDLSEAGPLYAGLSQDAVDLYPSAWPDITHKDYMDKYRKYIEDLGAYYDSAKLCWSVPDYSSLTSIEDIKPHASQIDNRIVGIESGSGLVKASEEKVIPAYGLQDMKFLTSSTPRQPSCASSAPPTRILPLTWNLCAPRPTPRSWCPRCTRTYPRAWTGSISSP